MAANLAGRLRAWLARFRHWPDRAGHDRRRAAVEESLRGRPIQGSVVMVCYGNICRSPYAEAALERHLTGGPAGLTVISAGFFGPDRTAPEPAVVAAAARGVDLTGHRSRLAAAIDPGQWGLAVVMEPRQVEELMGELGWAPRTIVLGDLDPEPIERRTIEDPYGKELAVFEQVYARIDRCVARLAAALAGK